MHLSLLSDGDLEAAFVSAAKPFLQLKMDVKPSEDSKSSALCLKHRKTVKLLCHRSRKTKTSRGYEIGV